MAIFIQISINTRKLAHQHHSLIVQSSHVCRIVVLRYAGNHQFQSRHAYQSLTKLKCWNCPKVTGRQFELAFVVVHVKCVIWYHSKIIDSVYVLKTNMVSVIQAHMYKLIVINWNHQHLMFTHIWIQTPISVPINRHTSRKTLTLNDHLTMAMHKLHSTF